MKYEYIKKPKELLEFMEQNITYGFVDKNGKQYTDQYAPEWNYNWINECIVQSGKEVLKTKIGTCWDQVELERLWFKSNNYEIYTIFMWLEINKINDLPTHAFLIYKDEEKFFLFEYADEPNKGIYEFNTYNEAVEYEKQNLLEYVIKSGKGKKEDYNLIKEYVYNEPLLNLSVKKYLKHVTEKA